MVSKTTILIVCLACGASALVAIIVIVSVYLWKQKQKKMKIADDKSLDTIESAASKDKAISGEGTSKDSTIAETKLANNTEINKIHETDVNPEKEKGELNDASSQQEKEMYPSFVTMFQVGSTNSSKLGNEKSKKKRSESMKGSKNAVDINEPTIGRNETISFPVKPMEKLSRALDRNDSLVNTFIDRSKTGSSDNNLFSYPKKEISYPKPKMTFSRTPSRCWEDLSADLENLNNLEGSSESDTGYEAGEIDKQRKISSENADNILSDSSTSDNMSYVVDPEKKTFVLAKTKKKVNTGGGSDNLTSDESDLESSPGVSHLVESDTNDTTDGDSDEEANSRGKKDDIKERINETQQQLKDASKDNDFSNTYHFSTPRSPTKHGMNHTLTHVEEYKDHSATLSNSNIPESEKPRPKTPQPSKENEIKRITNLNRNKSIPSNTRLNITPRFKSTALKKDEINHSNQESIEMPTPTNTTLDTNIVSISEPTPDLKSSEEKTNVPKERMLDKKDFETKSLAINLEPISGPGNKTSEEPSEVDSKERLKNMETSNTNNDIFSASLNLIDNTFKSDEMASKELKVSMSHGSAKESPKLRSSNEIPDILPVSAIQYTPTTQPIDHSNPSTLYPSSLLAASKSRKRKHSATRAPTPVRTLGAKPKKGILKKLAERKQLFQIRLPCEKETIDEESYMNEMKEKEDMSRDTKEFKATESGTLHSLSIDKSLTNEIGSSDKGVSIISKQDSEVVIDKDDIITTVEHGMVSSHVLNEFDESLTFDTGNENTVKSQSTNVNPNKSELFEEKNSLQIKDAAQTDNHTVSEWNEIVTLPTISTNWFNPDIDKAHAFSRDEGQYNDIKPHHISSSLKNTTLKDSFEINEEMNFTQCDQLLHELPVVISSMTNLDEKINIESENDTLYKCRQDKFSTMTKTKGGASSEDIVIGDTNDTNNRDSVEEEFPKPAGLKSQILTPDSVNKLKTNEDKEPGIKLRESESFTHQEPTENDTYVETNKDEFTSSGISNKIVIDKVNLENTSTTSSFHPRDQVPEEIRNEDSNILSSNSIIDKEVTKQDLKLQFLTATTDNEDHFDTEQSESRAEKIPIEYHNKKTKEHPYEINKCIDNSNADVTTVHSGKSHNSNKEDNNANDTDHETVKQANLNKEENFDLNGEESHKENVSNIQNKEKSIENLTERQIMKIDFQKDEQSGEHITEFEGTNLEIHVLVDKDEMPVVNNGGSLEESNRTISVRPSEEKKKRSKSFAGQIVRDAGAKALLNLDIHDHSEPCQTVVESNNEVIDSFATNNVMRSGGDLASTANKNTGRFSMSREYASKQQLSMLSNNATPFNNSKTEEVYHPADQKLVQDDMQQSSVGAASKYFQVGVSRTEGTLVESHSVFRKKEVTRRKTIHVSNFEAPESHLSPKLPSLQKGLRETALRSKLRHHQTLLHDSTNHTTKSNESVESAGLGSTSSFGTVDYSINDNDQERRFTTRSHPFSFGTGIKRNEIFYPHQDRKIQQEMPTVFKEREIMPYIKTFGTDSAQTTATHASFYISLRRNETFNTPLRPQVRQSRASAMRSKSLNRKHEFVDNVVKKEVDASLSGSLVVYKPSRVESSSKSLPAYKACNRLQVLPQDLDTQTVQMHEKVGDETEQTALQGEVKSRDPILLTNEERSVKDRPSSSYGRARPKSFKESLDKSVSRRPTTAADMITSKRTGLRRSKDKKPNLYASDDTLSDASQISDDVHEIVPLDKSVTNLSLKNIPQMEVKYKQPVSTRLTSRENVENFIEYDDKVQHYKRNPGSPIKPSNLEYFPIKNDLRKRDSNHSVRTLHANHRSSTPINDSAKTINFDSGKHHGERITNRVDKESLSIADQIKDKLASTFPAKRSEPTRSTNGQVRYTEDQGRGDRVSKYARLPSEKISHTITRSKTIGHGDRYPTPGNQTRPVQRSKTPGVGDRDKLQYRYDVKSILETAEILKSRNRYSHHMRTKSFN